MSPKTDRIWGFTDRWTVLSWKTNIQNYIYHRKYCVISSTTWIYLPLLLNVRAQFVTKLNDTGKPESFFRKQFLIHSWFQTLVMFCMLYVFFWVIPQHLNFICWHFGTLCLFHLPRQVHLLASEDGTDRVFWNVGI
jgi:hypothetical protein